MTKDRRWLNSAITASAQPLPALPWLRATRRRPQTVKPAACPNKASVIAAR